MCCPYLEIHSLHDIYLKGWAFPQNWPYKITILFSELSFKPPDPASSIYKTRYDIYGLKDTDGLARYGQIAVQLNAAKKPLSEPYFLSSSHTVG